MTLAADSSSCEELLHTTCVMTVHLTLKRPKEIGDRPWTVTFDCHYWSDRPTRPPNLGVRSPFSATTKLISTKKQRSNAANADRLAKNETGLLTERPSNKNRAMLLLISGRLQVLLNPRSLGANLSRETNCNQRKQTSQKEKDRP